MSENRFGPWTLSAEESKRLDGYRFLNDLLGTRAKEHDKLLNRDRAETPNSHVPHMYVNVPGLVCRAAADLILSQPPILRAEDESVQQRIDAISRRSKLSSLAWRAAYWVAGLGDGYFVLADQAQAPGDKKGLPVITFRRALGSVARNVRPEDPAFARSFIFKSALNGIDLYTEHKAGQIAFHAYKGTSAAKLPDGYAPIIQTREAVPLVVHLSALRGDESEEAFGESDFEGTDDLVFEIANRLRQVGRILDRHADPGMNVPDGMLDENGSLDIRNKKVFERGVSGEGAEYITWQSQLQEAYTEIDRLMKIIGLMTETPLALWGLDEAGQAESGRAMKFRLLSGLGKARRSGSMLKEGLAEAFRLALRREDIVAGRSPGEYELSVELSETFIADELDTATLVQTLRTSKSMSVRAAVGLAQGLTGEELDQEVQAIQDETQSEVPLGLEGPRFG